MHHKRRRPKNRRSGCLFCKFHKANGVKRQWGAQLPAWKRHLVSTAEQLREL